MQSVRPWRAWREKRRIWRPMERAQRLLVEVRMAPVRLVYSIGTYVKHMFFLLLGLLLCLAFGFQWSWWKGHSAKYYYQFLQYSSSRRLVIWYHSSYRPQNLRICRTPSFWRSLVYISLASGSFPCRGEYPSRQQSIFFGGPRTMLGLDGCYTISRIIGPWLGGQRNREFSSIRPPGRIHTRGFIDY